MSNIEVKAISCFDGSLVGSDEDSEGGKGW